MTDQRYHLATVHMTPVRFAAPLREQGCFVAALATARLESFGSTTVQRLELVSGHWFHAAAHEQLVAEFQLR